MLYEKFDPGLRLHKLRLSQLGYIQSVAYQCKAVV